MFTDSSRAHLPLKGYVVLSGVYAGTMACLFYWAHRTGRIPDTIPMRDVVLLGVGAHRSARDLSRDKVLTFLREPFTEYEGVAGALPGEVREHHRHGGALREATADLVTCPYCLAQWTASGLFAVYLANRPLARLMGGILTAVTIADFLHTAYVRANRT